MNQKFRIEIPSGVFNFYLVTLSVSTEGGRADVEIKVPKELQDIAEIKAESLKIAGQVLTRCAQSCLSGQPQE